MTTPKTITAWVSTKGEYTFEAGQLLPNGWQGKFISEDLAAELVRAGMEAAADHIEPKNERDDWTQYAHDKHAIAASVRYTSTNPKIIAAIVAKVMGEGE